MPAECRRCGRRMPYLARINGDSVCMDCAISSVRSATDSIAADLRVISTVIRAQQRHVRNLERQRADAIRQALADGWTHAQIAEATGLTRGRINQLAHPTGGTVG